MSNKLKNNSDKIERVCLDNNMSVSFEYITKNDQYNLNYFNKSKDIRNKSEFLTNLFDIIQELTSNTFIYFMGKDRRKIGFEKINDIKFSPNIRISADEQIYSKRIKNKYRMLFIFRNNIIYIIGFDFDFTAYKHS